MLRHLEAVTFISIGLAGLVGGGIALVWRFWDFVGGHKRPTWLINLYGASLKMTAIPRWFFRVFFQHPGSMIEEIELAFIEIIRKFKSRVFLVLVILFAFIAIILIKKDANWQLFTGLSGMVVSLTPIIYIFIGARNKEWDQSHELKMQALKMTGPNGALIQEALGEVKDVVMSRAATPPPGATDPKDDTPPRGDL